MVMDPKTYRWFRYVSTVFGFNAFFYLAILTAIHISATRIFRSLNLTLASVESVVRELQHLQHLYVSGNPFCDDWRRRASPRISQVQNWDTLCDELCAAECWGYMRGNDWCDADCENEQCGFDHGDCL